MAWTTQYYHLWKDPVGLDCRIDIKKDAAAGDILIEAQPSPIRIILPKIESKFQAVRGKGAELNFINETDRQLIGLFSAAMQQYRVEYRYNSNLVLFGYLDSNKEYTEDYTQLLDYPVQFTASDGLGLLERIKFMNGSSKYTGIKSKWEILEIVLTKWGLLDLVDNIKICLATTSEDISLDANEVILHKSYVSCCNYYDEDGQAASCRQVLEHILKPYGAFLTIIGTDICIIDIHTLAIDSSFNWQMYTTGSGFPADDPATKASDVIPEIETLGYYETGAALVVEPGINRQVIRYSRYAPDSLDDNLQDEDDYNPAPEFTLQEYYGTTHYMAMNMETLPGWTGPVYILARGYKQTITDPPEYVVSILNPNLGATPPIDEDFTTVHMAKTWPGPYVIGSPKFYLKISAQMRAKTRINPYEEGTFNDTAKFERLRLLARIFIGNKCFGRFDQTWHTPGSPYTINDQINLWIGESEGNCRNKWLPVHTFTGYSQKMPLTDDAVYIALDDGIHGQVKLEFCTMMWAYNDSVSDDNQTVKVRRAEIRDIKIELVTNPGMKAVSTDDLEYVGEIQQAWLDEGQDVILNQGGSAAHGSPFDNGAIMYLDSGVYYHVTQWTRAGVTNIIEKLLLNTIHSNGENSTTRINGIKLNNLTHLPYLRIKDTTHLPGKILMVAGGMIDPSRDLFDQDLVEIVADNLL